MTDNAYLYLGSLTLIIAIFFLVDAMYKRSYLKKTAMRVTGTVRKSTRTLPSTIIDYTLFGDNYSTMPFRVYSLRQGHKLQVYILPESGKFVCVDIWSENHKWRYIVSGILFVIGFTLLGILIATSL